MRELRDELHRIAGEAAGAAQPLPPHEVMRRGARWRRQRAVRRAAAGLAVACILVAAVVFSVPAVRQVILTRPVSSGSRGTPAASPSPPHRRSVLPYPVPSPWPHATRPGPQPSYIRPPSPVPTRLPANSTVTPKSWPSPAQPSPVPTLRSPSASPIAG